MRRDYVDSIIIAIRMVYKTHVSHCIADYYME
jgi:hypothetical protein